MGFTTSGMENKNWTLQAEKILAVDSATIDLDQIPENYKYILVFISAAINNGSSSPSNVNLTLNGETGSVYFYQYLQAASSVISAAKASGSSAIPMGEIQDIADGYSTIQIFICHVPESQPRGLEIHGGSFEKYRLTSGYFDKTDYITRITLTPDAGPFAAGSRISVYGVS